MQTEEFVPPTLEETKEIVMKVLEEVNLFVCLFVFCFFWKKNLKLIKIILLKKNFKVGFEKKRSNKMDTFDFIKLLVLKKKKNCLKIVNFLL